MTKYYEGLEYYDIEESKWKKNEKTGIQQKLVDSMVPVYHVPFCKVAKTITTIDEIVKNSNKLVFEFDIESNDAPFGDVFTIKEVWIILPN